MSIPLMVRMNLWPSQISCLATASLKQHWGVILHNQLQPHPTRSWDSFLAQMMEMKLVQCIVTLRALEVAVALVVSATTIVVVQSCRTVHVQMSCGPCNLMDQRHKMAQEPSVF